MKKRLLLDIDPKIHKEIRVAASLRNLSIKKYVLEAVLWRLKSEVHPSRSNQ